MRAQLAGCSYIICMKCNLKSAAPKVFHTRSDETNNWHDQDDNCAKLASTEPLRTSMTTTAQNQAFACWAPGSDKPPAEEIKMGDFKEKILCHVCG